MHVNYIKFEHLSLFMEEDLQKLYEITENMTGVVNAILKNKLDKDIVLDEFKKQKQAHYNKLLENSVKEIMKIGNELDKSVKKYESFVELKNWLMH